MAGLASTACGQITGPSSSVDPYLLPSAVGVQVVSVLTVGDSVNDNLDGSPYRMAGKPDGLGAFDNGDGTFSLLMNHELSAGTGAVHAHGASGAFVSRWIIDSATLTVLHGCDLIQRVYSWDVTGHQYVLSPNRVLARLCSADLPAPGAFFYAATGLGTQNRLFMNGEENGTEGRAYAVVVTGADLGSCYELPRLGRFNRENSVTNPDTRERTLVIGLDDTAGGQLYAYVGQKSTSGNDVERAGLNNGALHGVVVPGLLAENTVTGLGGPRSRPFTLVSLGDVSSLSGAALETASNAIGVMHFQRPEDGHWDPRSADDFYFVTTGSAAPARLWRLRFTSRLDPTLGGVIELMLTEPNGTAGLDNITVDNSRVLMQEDVGSSSRLAKIWMRDLRNGALTEIAAHSAEFFTSGGARFLTQTEESSGIIDLREILGGGWYILDSQAHYGIPGELVEGGQLLAMHVLGNQFVLGDMNCDGAVSVADIAAFVLALTDPAAYMNLFPDCDVRNADLNTDGEQSVADIAPFVQALTEA